MIPARVQRSVLWLAGLCVLAGCGPFYANMAAERTAYAKSGKGAIVIAVINDLPGYLNGVRLAYDELVRENGGLLGRPVELLVFPGSVDVDKVRATARRIAANPQVTAVIGHRFSSVAIPASVIYEAAQVLFMPPFSTSEQLTTHGFEFVLRMMPNNAVLAEQTVSLASLFGYKRIAVLHARDNYNRAATFLFENAARDADIDIAFRGSFFASETNYRALIAQMQGVDFDAIYLSTYDESAAQLLPQLRELDIHNPVLGSDALSSVAFARRVGAAGDRTIVPTVFVAGGGGTRKQRFEQAYEERYGRTADPTAAQGYDCFQVLATLIERAGTTDPSALSTTAHYSPPIAGITGIYAFDERGEIYGKSYRFQVLRFGRLWELPGARAPYLLAHFQEIAPEADATASKRAQKSSAPRGDTQADSTAAGDDAPMSEALDDGNDLADQIAPEEKTESPAEVDFSLAALTKGRLSVGERNRIWLALAQQILDFQRLGLVVSVAETRGAAAVSLARAVAEQRGFEVDLCALPDPGSVEQEAYERAALVCYSRLARTVDAMFVELDTTLAPAYVNRLNRVLRGFGVPSFALAESIDADYGLTLALVGTGVELVDAEEVFRFDGLLEGLEVHQLNRKLSNLPSVSIDLRALEDLGVRLDPRELTVVSRVLEAKPALASQGSTRRSLHETRP